MAKKKKSPKVLPARVKILAGILIMVLMLGIWTVKYLESTRGIVFLIDHGLTSYYPLLQNRVNSILSQTAEELSISHKIRTSKFRIRTHGKALTCIQWAITCTEPCNLVKLNLAFTEALTKKSIFIISSKEAKNGERLTIEAGTRMYPTHKIIVMHAKESELNGEVSWEPRGGEAGASLPKLALIIDDFGYSSNGAIRNFLSLNFPITISIIPELPFSEYVLQEAIKNGKEVILHLPMEPEGEYKTDVQIIGTNMSDRDIRELVERYASGLPGIRGVNNHMGSKATQDRRVMRAVLKVLERKGLFFLDSLTSPRSLAYNEAKSLGLRTAKNELFLDTDTEESSTVEKRLEDLIAIAKKKGEAIGIAHPRPWTYEVLKGWERNLRRSDVRMVFLSELMENN